MIIKDWSGHNVTFYMQYRCWTLLVLYTETGEKLDYLHYSPVSCENNKLDNVMLIVRWQLFPWLTGQLVSCGKNSSNPVSPGHEDAILLNIADWKMIFWQAHMVQIARCVSVCIVWHGLPAAWSVWFSHMLHVTHIWRRQVTMTGAKNWTFIISKTTPPIS